MKEDIYNFRTDMADERVDEYKKVHNLSDISGIKVEANRNNLFNTTTVEVLNEIGKQALNKEIGKYITIELNEILTLTDTEKENISQHVANEIKILLGRNISSVMVVGLGNEYVTPDALGPKVIANINVTRHAIKYAKELIEPGTREISAISPGVLGMTGIETEEIIESIVNNVKPDIIIVIDSLASKSVLRVGKTIQIGNTGITPGAGVGNKRKMLNEKSLGIPVIALGVPTVVDLGTIINEGLNIFIEKLQEKSESNVYLNKLKENDNYEEIKNALAPDNYNMIVTPKEIDELIENMKDIIAKAINYAI